MEMFEYLALFALLGFGIYQIIRTNKLNNEFNRVNNELIKYQTLDENKINLDDESYPFNKTLKDLEETIEKKIRVMKVI